VAAKVLDPTPDQRRAIDRHLDELDTWNRRLNLTAVPRAEAWERHVVESLELLAAAELEENARCADLGSGGGIPGLVVAVVRPDLSVTLIESDRRKAGFLVHMCGLLEITNVTVAARRAEEMGADPAHRDSYDAVLSRAAAPPALLTTLAMPLLRVGGSLWALVAPADASAATRALAEDSTVRARQPSPGILAVQKVSQTGPDQLRTGAAPPR
jgi:16S rRNA (guanine527-N7)-methyltransferase